MNILVCISHKDDLPTIIDDWMIGTSHVQEEAGAFEHIIHVEHINEETFRDTMRGLCSKQRFPQLSAACGRKSRQVPHCLTQMKALP